MHVGTAWQEKFPGPSPSGRAPRCSHCWSPQHQQQQGNFSLLHRRLPILFYFFLGFFFWILRSPPSISSYRRTISGESEEPSGLLDVTLRARVYPISFYSSHLSVRADCFSTGNFFPSQAHRPASDAVRQRCVHCLLRSGIRPLRSSIQNIYIIAFWNKREVTLAIYVSVTKSKYGRLSRANARIR